MFKLRDARKKHTRCAFAPLAAVAMVMFAVTAVFAAPTVAKANPLVDAWNSFVSILAGDDSADATPNTKVDDSTITSWQEHLTTDGTPNGSKTTQNIGRIWTDKTVSNENIVLTHSDGSNPKTIAKGGSDFLIGLSALSSTSNLETATNKPLDISLVLDLSGSMKRPMTKYTKVYAKLEGIKDTGNENDYSGTEYYTFDENGTLIKLQWKKKPRNLDQRQRYGWRDSDAKDNPEKGELSSSDAANWYTPIQSEGDSAQGQRVQFYTGKESDTTKIVALKQSVKSFINEMAKQNEKISDNDLKHRIALVKFATTKSDKVGNDKLDAGSEWRNYTQIVKELTSDAAELNNTVGPDDNENGLTTGGATAADWGLEKAQESLSEAYGGRKNAQKVVIFFTDGEPNHEANWDPVVANSAIATAKQMKADGTLIYSIGVFGNADPSIDPKGDAATNFDKYMHGVSSNYKNAESLDNLGERTKKDDKDANYYFASTSPEELDQVFKEIAADIQHSTVGAPTNVTEGAQDTSGYITFTDQLGDYMKVDDFKNIVYADTVYERTGKTTDGNVDTYVFSHEVEGNAVYPTDGDLGDIKITVTRAGDDDLKTGDTVEVKIPASLIPLRNFKVNKATDDSTTMSVDEAYPIRVFFGVNLKDGVKDKIASGEFAKDENNKDYVASHTDNDGNVYFLSNSWDGKKAEYPANTGGTTASFQPAKNNGYYYLTQDTPIYTDEECKTPATGELDTDAIYYYKQVFYTEKDGKTEETFKVVNFKGDSTETLQGAVDYKDGKAYFRAGTPKLEYIREFQTDKKPGANKTETGEAVLNPNWDEPSISKVNTLTQRLGNNGKLQVQLPATLNVTKKVTVPVGFEVNDFKDTDFNFTVTSMASKGKTVNVEVKADGQTVSGAITTLTFKEDGTANFTLKNGQTISIEGLNPGEYKVEENAPDYFTTTTSGDDSGTLAANDNKSVTFTNAYKPSSLIVNGSEVFKGQKVLSGRDWMDGDSFTFNISSVSGAPDPDNKTVTLTNAEAKGASDGTPIAFNFGKVTFTKPGIYEYDMTEAAGADGGERLPGVTYTNVNYRVKIIVKNDPVNGKLFVSETTVTKTADDLGNHLNTPEAVNGGVATFTNTYTKHEAQSAIEGTKVYKDSTAYENNTDGDKPLKDDMFSFKVTPEGNAPMPATFTPAEGDRDSAIVTNQGNTISFPMITFVNTMDGNTYTYLVSEVMPAGATPGNNYTVNGMTYDPNTYKVSVTVSLDSKGDVKLAWKYMDKDGNELKDPGNPFKPATRLYFHNSYTPAPTEVTIEGSKTLTGRAWDEANSETFGFQLTSDDDDTKTAIDNGWVAVPDENGTEKALALPVTAEAMANDPTHAFNFGNMKFTHPGTFTFQVNETSWNNQKISGLSDADKKGMTFDTHTAEVTVVVTNNEDGKLTAGVTYNNGQNEPTDKAVFNNSYAATGTLIGATNLKGTKVLMKNGEKISLLERKWDFTIAGTGDATLKAIEAGDVVLPNTKTVQNNEKGEFSFGDITFKSTGVQSATYTFNVTESGVVPGVTNDPNNPKKITVLVGDDGAGKLTAVVQANESDNLAFTNTYKTEGDSNAVTPKVTKKIVGSEANGKTFSFDLAPDMSDEFTRNNISHIKGLSDEKLTVTTTDALTTKNNETLTFGGLSFDAEGTYKFTIKEITASGAGWTNDTTAKSLAIKVSDNGQGGLTAVIESGDNPTVTNEYVGDSAAKPVDTSTLFSKSISGRDWFAGDEFGFTLTAKTDGAPMPEGTAEGSATATTTVKAPQDKAGEQTFGFGTFKFSYDDIKDATQQSDGSRSKDFEYEVTENDLTDAQKAAGLTKDTHTAKLTITVKDNGKGELTATPVVTAENGKFVNTYSTSVDYTAKAGIQLSKTLTGRDMTPGQFAFTLSDFEGDVKGKLGLSDAENAYTVTAAKDGEASIINLFNGKTVKFTNEDVGTYSFDVTETKVGGNGYTNDTEPRHVEIAVTYDKTSGVLTVTTTVTKSGKEVATSTVNSNDAVETQAQPVVIPFSNSYKASGTIPASGDVALKATKTLTGRPATAGEFAFTVKDSNGKQVATGTNAAAADGQPGAITFSEIKYDTESLKAAVADKSATKGQDKADKDTYTFQYTVSEQTAGLSDKAITPGASNFVVTVVVTDNGDGTLTPTITYPDGSNGSLSFTNAYATTGSAEVTFNGIKSLKKANDKLTLTPADIAGKFTFTLSSDDKDAPMPKKTTATNDAVGNVYFGNVTYSQPTVMDGTEPDANGVRTRSFTYTVTESGSAAGVTNDEKASKTFTVTLTEYTKAYDGHAAGTIVAKVNPTADADFGFRNTYAVTPVDSSITDDGQLKVSKTISGRPLVDGEFQFEMVEGIGDQAKQVATGKNDANGVVSFSKIHFAEPGEHDYILREIPGEAGNGVTFDTKNVAAHASVVDNGDGTLSVTWSFAAGKDGKGSSEVTFENGYKPASTALTFAAAKTLDGRDLKDGEFAFKLTQTGVKDGKTWSAKNDANGQVTFPTLTFVEPGTYEFEVSEVKGDDATIIYDGTVYKLKVEVTDDLQGHLSAKATYENGEPVFTNTYTKPADPKPTPKPEEPKAEEPKAPALPQTGDTSALPVVVAAVAGVACIGGGLALSRRRK